MNKLLKKLTAFLTCFSVFVSMMPGSKAFADNSANQSKNNSVSISIAIQERNGVSVEDYFFRRGIALEKGKIFSAEDICLKENGKVIPSHMEALQTHDDGSIAWILVSGIIDLKPSECKNLIVTNGKWNADTKTTYTQNTTHMTVDAAKIDMEFGPVGIESLKYDGVEKLNGTPINLYATVGGKTDYLKVTEISVLKNTKAYSKFKLKGRLNEKICGEMYVTVAENTSRVQIDHRITVEDNFMVESTGLTIGATYKGAKEGTVIDSDFLDLGNMQLSTYDNTRFNGATNVPESTGYIIGKNTVTFAPIVNGKAYQYYDGFSRTAHLYITFYRDAENYAKTLALPPVIKVDNEQYVRAGQILTTDMSALNKKGMDSYKFAYSKSTGIFSAGSVPWELNSDLGIVGKFGNTPGELEYNFGVCWMQSGDEEIFRYMVDIAELRADLLMYRGGRPDIYGCLRGSSMTDTYRFNMAHSYYGDQGGLIMAYLLTGDEWVYDTLTLSLEKTIQDMYLRQSLDGSRSYYYRSWPIDTSSPSGLFPEYHESRGMIRVRTWYMAYQLFKDERYLTAMKDLLHWAKAAQKESGAYPHFVYHDGSKLFDSISHEEVVKDYIMLYGFRGVSQLLDFVENDTALELTINVADYLCSLHDRFGDFLWMATSDLEVYSWGAEEGATGASPFTTLLSLDVLCTAYEQTENEKYLIVLADFLEAYLGSELGGLGAEKYTAEICAPKGSNPMAAEGLRSTTLLRFSDNLSKIFSENKERLLELGYENVLLIFEKDAEGIKDGSLLKYEAPDVLYNVYQSGDTKAVFLRNMGVKDSKPEGDWEKTVQLVFNENKLWQGATNVATDNSSVMLEEYLEQYEGYSAKQRPIYIEQLLGKVSADIIEYSKDKIEIDFYGEFDAGIKITDGIFKIDNSQGYNIELKAYANGTKVVVTKGGSVKPVNGAIAIQFNNNGEVIPVVGKSTLKDVGLDGVDVNATLSATQLKGLMKNLFNQDVNFKSSTPTWSDFAAAFIPAVGANNKAVLENAGLDIAFDAQRNAVIPDSAAVLYGAEALSVIYSGAKLSSDVYLAKESLYGTKVSWKCNREDIISPDGVLTRANADCDSVILTATVTKNSAVTTREFQIPLAKMSVPTAEQGPGFTEETAFPLIPQKSEFEITYTAIPYKANIDSTMCFTSSEISTRTNADIPYIVRFNPNGVIDMYNSNTYTTGVIKYEPNKRYFFRIVIRPDKMTYDAYVTPEGGEELVIGTNCGSRQSAPIISQVDKFWTWAGEDNCYKVMDVSIIQKDDQKTQPVGNGFYDENGLVFGKYRFSKTSVFPTVSENGLIMNWVKAGSYRPELGGQMVMYLGKEGTRSTNISLIQTLQEVGLLDSSITAASPVTPASLSRILVSMQNKNK